MTAYTENLTDPGPAAVWACLRFGDTRSRGREVVGGDDYRVQLIDDHGGAADLATGVTRETER